MTVVNMHEARSQLSRPVARAEAGVRISDDFDAPIPDFEGAFYDGPLEP